MCGGAIISGFIHRAAARRRTAESEDDFEAEFEEFEADFEEDSSEDDLDDDEVEEIGVKPFGSRESTFFLGCRCIISSSNGSKAPAVESIQSASSIKRPALTQSCYCGLIAKVSTTIMSVPNFGRRFITCPKAPGDDQCGMFQWIDPEPTHNMIEVGTRVVDTITKISALAKEHKKIVAIAQTKEEQAKKKMKLYKGLLILTSFVLGLVLNYVMKH